MREDPKQAWIVRAEAKAARAAALRAAADAAVEAERLKRAEFRAGRKATIGSMNDLKKAVARTPSKSKAIQRPDFRLMPATELAQLAEALLRAEKYDWSVQARPEQLFPKGCIIWLLMCGRGWGKTRAAAEKVRQVCETPNMRVAMVAKDHRALRDVCLEGVSGLLACIPPEQIKKVHKGLGDVSVELVNGSTIKGYTAGEPDAVRGLSFDMVWADEFAAWPRNRAQDMLDQLRLCMRESRAGAICILSTTPKRIPHVIDIVKLAENPEERITIARGRSRDNTALNAEWHRQMERKLGGTRLGRQELDGELLTDVENALWSGRMIDEARFDPECSCTKDPCRCSFDIPPLAGVMTGVDPSGSSDGDATGIVTVGWTKDKVLYVLENKSTKGEPGVRYRAVCMSAFQNKAQRIFFEVSYGGDNAAYGIQQAWKDCQREGLIPNDRPCPPLQGSTIKGDKAGRAGPVVQLYEQQMNKPDIRRIYHVAPNDQNGIAALEDELLGWDTTTKLSPNALDALVHVCRAIMTKLGMDPTTITSPASPYSTRRVRGGYDPFAR